MPFRKGFEFPPDEELEVQEVNITSSFLRAGAIHLGKFCEKENNEFMLCKSELRDPRKCLKEGKDVTNCTLKFFCLVRDRCRHEFDQYANCLNMSSGTMNYKFCKKTQKVFDQCVLDKIGLERPPLGWQAEVHIHESERPEPKKEAPIYFPDTPAELPYDPKSDKQNFSEPKFGLRNPPRNDETK